MSPIVMPVQEDTDDPIAAPLFAFIKSNNAVSSIPKLFLTLARAPHIFKGWSEFAWPMRTQSSSPRSIRELAICRVLQLAGADNEFAYHSAMGVKAGLTQAQIDALADWRSSKLYSAPERAVLAVAEEIASGPAASREKMLELKKHFQDGEIVEITITACFYVLVSRFVESMGIEHDDPTIISAISNRT